MLHVLRGLFPREQQRGEDGEDAARELGRDDGAEHGRVVACREAEVVAEDEGRRDGEGDVHDFAALVHVLHHAEHGDGVCKARHEPGGGRAVHAEQASEGRVVARLTDLGWGGPLRELFATDADGRPVDAELSRARLAACDAVRSVLELVLSLIGVSAPTTM